MSNKTVMKPLAVALGTAFITSLAGTSVANAAENPFGMTELSSGYMVSDAKERSMHEGQKNVEKMKEGKCGEGKCGEGMEKKAEKAKEGKCGEGKCGEAMEKGKAEGKCGEGKCGEGMKDKADKAKEGKCGEGKCGGSK